MASIKLEKITLIIRCDCGGNFLAEDFEPVCPYCDRAYDVSMAADPKRLQLSVNSTLETVVQSYG